MPYWSPEVCFRSLWPWVQALAVTVVLHCLWRLFAPMHMCKETIAWITKKRSHTLSHCVLCCATFFCGDRQILATILLNLGFDVDNGATAPFESTTKGDLKALKNFRHDVRQKISFLHSSALWNLLHMSEIAIYVHKIGISRLWRDRHFTVRASGATCAHCRLHFAVPNAP